MSTGNESNRVVYTNDGYAVAWSRLGLEIRSIDYHAGELRLTWENIMKLAEDAGAAEPSDSEGERSWKLR